ncbi:MAG: acyl-CoA dehydrogenase family protein, partial [Gemmatimonadota bacterium]|nr:acyl-CoA dehydrogenase family protein [Gemmatimonadota bacterium]
MAKPSFMRGLFAGEIADELMFPFPPPLDRRNPAEAARVRALIAALNDMVATGLIDSAKFDAEETIPKPVIRAFAESGLLGIAIPQEFGGLGFSTSAYARVFGAVASIDPSLGVFIGVHCGLCSKAIVLFGNQQQNERYLPLLASGAQLGAYALTEPETGSDAQHIVSRAER